MSHDWNDPEQIDKLLKSYLKESGLERRIEQASVIPEWPTLVGDTIAAVTEPLFVTADGTLFVAVHTHAWMTELQLMVPQLISALNTKTGRSPIRKLRFQIRRDQPL
jgi:predicted nucleic acid-binding Zn ribbon protein